MEIDTKSPFVVVSDKADGIDVITNLLPTDTQEMLYLLEAAKKIILESESTSDYSLNNRIKGQL